MQPERTLLLRRSEIEDVLSLRDCIDANVAAGRLTNPEVRCAGISINTSALDASTADSLLKQTADAFGLPCVDPVRGGVAEIVDRL